MKRLILFSMVCLMATITQAQNGTTVENDSVAWDKMLSEISVTGHRHIVRMKGNTLVAQVANTELANLGTANDVPRGDSLDSTKHQRTCYRRTVSADGNGKRHAT